MRRAGLAAAAACAALLLGPLSASAQAAFGFLPGQQGFDVTATEEDGSPDTSAGSHPFEMTTTIDFKRTEESHGHPGEPFTEGDLRDLHVDLPPGLIEDPAAVPQCSLAQFNTPRASPFEASLSGESCPDKTQIGVIAVHTSYGGETTRSFGVFNLVPPPGAPSRFGFAPFGVPITFAPQISQHEGEYALSLQSLGFPQLFDLYGFSLTIWGTPWNVAHNTERGNCLNEANPEDPYGKCSIGRPAVNPPHAYLSLPPSCTGPPRFTASADSWQQAPPASASVVYHDAQGRPLGLGGCDLLNFNPAPLGLPTTTRTSSPSGFDLVFNQPEEGLLNPRLTAPSQVKKAVVTLPEGMTINPSLAAGLGVCTAAQYAAETVSSPPGAGCPSSSKIGDFSVQSPLFEAPVAGALYLAEPDNPASGAPGAENPFDSLIAIYLIAKAPERDVIVKVAGKLDPNPTSGRLTATFDDLPQLPYSHFKVHFREGQRSPLLTPPACGSYQTHTVLSPWLDPNASLDFVSAFELEEGIEGSACPSGTPPFAPGANAGTLNPNAGSYSPFYLHLTRRDTDQEITSYSTLLPPGLLGKIAGIPYCPEADIEAAKEKTGTEEAEHPSCPAASEIGHTYSGYGVGSVLAYAPGRLYLAGPYHGSTFSVVAIDSATVGPFDLGVIVVRAAIRIDPHTAQVSIDSADSDPIPHIIDGIPIHLRDVRVYINRPEFTINPTSCDPFSVVSTLTGSAAPFTNPHDISATAPVPFQASNCAALSFAPRFEMRLTGGTKRGAYPELTATVTPRPGDANIGTAAVTLPPSIFLAQNHIHTICTTPQLQAEACPPESVYGEAQAITPLLGEPLEGPVYLASSPNRLPDLVADLHGSGVRILLDGRIDSSQGGIRGSFDVIPDAPVSKFTMTIYGGSKRGLLQNAANVCTSSRLATALFTGQDNAAEALHPRLVNARCNRRPAHRRGRAPRGGRRK